MTATECTRLLGTLGTFQNPDDRVKVLLDAINEEVKATVLVERLACARIASSTGDVYNIGFCIAEQIRARKDED